MVALIGMMIEVEIPGLLDEKQESVEAKLGTVSTYGNPQTPPK